MLDLTTSPRYAVVASLVAPKAGSTLDVPGTGNPLDRQRDGDGSDRQTEPSPCGPSSVVRGASDPFEQLGRTGQNT